MIARDCRCALPPDAKAAVRASADLLGVPVSAYVETHNHDSRGEHAVCPAYRAAAVALRGERPVNLHRLLRGGVTVGEILAAAGLWPVGGAR